MCYLLAGTHSFRTNTLHECAYIWYLLFSWVDWDNAHDVYYSRPDTLQAVNFIMFDTNEGWDSQH